VIKIYSANFNHNFKQNKFQKLSEVLSVITTIQLGAGTKPHHVNASADGRYVFGAEFGANKIAMIDTLTDTLSVLTASTSPTAKTHAVWVTESGIVYAANTVINQIAAIDPMSNTIFREIIEQSNFSSTELIDTFSFTFFARREFAARKAQSKGEHFR